MTAVAATDGHPERVDVRVDVVVADERTTRRATQRRDELVPDTRRSKRDRQRSARAPEANALHRVAASYAASAGIDTDSSAARSEGKTSTTCPKRAMSKISATIGCMAATAIRAPRERNSFAAIISRRSPMLLMYPTPERSRTSALRALAASSTNGASAGCNRVDPA